MAMTPWKDIKDLRRLWVLSAQFGGKQFVYDAIWMRYGKKRLHDLTESEFYELLEDIKRKEKESGCTCKEHHGWASCGQYRRIKWLQKRLLWDDRRLLSFVKRCAHVDSLRFLTVDKARGVIAGLEKILKKKEERENARKDM